MFLHLWASTFKHIGIDVNAAPPAGSFMHELLAGQIFPDPVDVPIPMGRPAHDQEILSTVLGSGSLGASIWTGGRRAVRRSLQGLWRRHAAGREVFENLFRRFVRAGTLCAARQGAIRVIAARKARPTRSEHGWAISGTSWRALPRYGPVFKAWWHGSYTTCIVGNARGRRLLAENEDQPGAPKVD